MRRALFLLGAALAAPVSAQRALPFDDGWTLTGDSTAVETVDGRQALRLTTGRATRRDVRLEDGTIDVDVKVTRRRSFVYVGFRMVDDENHEEFYLRPHKSLLPDAVQYAPVDQGQSAWQLHHGPGGTAAPEIAPNVWTRLRVVLSGRRAAVFLGDTTKPVLLIPRLARDPAPGYLALYAFLPAETPGAGPIAWFSNVRVSPGAVPYAFGPEVPDSTPPAGLIRAWSVGRPFSPPDSLVTALAPERLADATRVEAGPGGLVNLARQVGMPLVAGPNGTRVRASRGAAAVARVRIVAERAGVRRLDLGFSDAATVFLNGVPLVYRDDSYDYPRRRDGLIMLGQAVVYLPLRAGANDLAVLVADRFGGWGLMGRLPDARGVRVEVP
jgi:hypothetical protein